MSRRKKKHDKAGRNFQIEEDARHLAHLLDQGLPPGVGFTLFLFETGDEQWLTYISNANREDMIKVIEEWLERQRNVPGGISTSPN